MLEIQKPHSRALCAILGLSFIKGKNLTLFFCFFPGFDDQGVRHQFPKILDLHIHEVIFLAQALHDLVAAVVAGSDQELCACILDLLGFCPTVKDPLFNIRARPGSPTCTTAQIVRTVGMHLHIVFATLLGHPTRFFVISVAESALTLTAIIAGVMEGRQFFMDGFVYLDAAFFYIFLQKIMNAYKLNAFVCIPFLQTKPGRVIGVPSFRQDEIFTP